MSSKPNDVLIEHFYLKLIKSKVDGVELTEEELKAKTELSKAIWVGGVGGLDKVEQRTVSRSDLDDEYEDHECPLPEN